MQTKAANPIDLVPQGTIPSFVTVYFEINHLKQLYRQGWLQAGILENRCESFASHSFGSAVLALFIADTFFPELDLCKVVRLILFHGLLILTGHFLPTQFAYQTGNSLALWLIGGLLVVIAIVVIIYEGPNRLTRGM